MSNEFIIEKLEDGSFAFEGYSLSENDWDELHGQESLLTIPSTARKGK